MKQCPLFLTVALVVGAAVPALAQPQPAPPPAEPVPPPAPIPPAAPPPIAPPPTTGTPGPSTFELREAPEARLVGSREALRPVAGGLTANQVAARTREVSPEAQAKEAGIRAAAARVDKTVVMFLPRVKVSATYRRVSPTETSFGEGAVVVTREPADSLSTLPCTTDGAGVTTCPLPVAAAQFSFPTFENHYLLNANIGVPLSDYVFRISNALRATRTYQRAAEIQKQAALVQAASTGRVAYYNWLRAVAAQAVAESALGRSRALLEDTKTSFTLGAATKADVLRVEAMVAGAEQMVTETTSLRALASEQLSTLMDEPARAYQVGEDVLGAPPPPPPADLAALIAEAQGQRLEVKAIGAMVAAQDQGIRAARVGQYPRLDAFGDFTYARPNTTVFPQEDKWKQNWVVGLSLSYTLNDPLDSRATIREIEASQAEVVANRTLLTRGIRLEVTSAHSDALRARAAVDTAQRAAAAAEEGYRVARELYRAGRATTTDLISAESELVQASLREVNALLDVKVADAKLEHALGRDVAGPR